MKRLYVQQQLQPSVICQAVNDEYGTTFSLPQIYRAVERWKEKRDAIVKHAEGMADRSVARIARDHAVVMDEFAAKAKRHADKADKFADRARDPRSFAAAVGAFAVSIKTFRLVTGLEAAGNKPGNHTFNYNFTNVSLPEVNARPMKEAIPV